MKDEKKTINENSSLMKKTKAQLVEIILRKDEVERCIRKDLAKANYNIGMMQEEIHALSRKRSAPETAAPHRGVERNFFLCGSFLPLLFGI